MMAHDDERRSIKLQLMISPHELRAIDDWRFRARRASRAEAIRTLVARALAAEPQDGPAPTDGDRGDGGTGTAR